MSEEPEAVYRAALRRAERALALDRPNAALLAYAEAAAASPERAGPYVAMGALHLGAGRIPAAIEAFDGALRRSPAEPDALRGRAEALVRSGRPADAAAALDAVAGASDARGQTLDAMIAARRALELAESRARRRALGSLVERVRGLPLDQAADGAPTADEIAAAERLLRVADEQAPEALPPGLAKAIADLDRADLAAMRGDAAAARAAYLDAATGLASADCRDAALDTCFAALIVAPDDVRLHLRLAEIYARAGWSAQLVEKTRVLGRFLELEPDAAAVARLVAISGDAGR